MNAKKRLLAMVCMSTLVLSFTFYGSGASDPIEEFLVNQSEALDTLPQIIDGFPMTYDADDNPIYPESYGDCYINDEGNLVICIVDNEYADEFRATLPENVETKLVKYSLNQLNEFKKYLVDIGFNPDGTFQFIGIGNNGSVNKIGISVEDEARKEFYENRIAEEWPDYIDAYYIEITPYKDEELEEEFEYKEPEDEIMPAASLTLHPGDQLTSVFGNFTLGYFARRGNKMGIVTAGHCAKRTDIVTAKERSSSAEPVAVGICDYSEVGGSLDIAFIPMERAYQYSNLVADDPKANAYISAVRPSNVNSKIPVGTAIITSGIKTGLYGGKVLKSDETYGEGTNVPVAHCIVTNIALQHGDSGAPLLARNGDYDPVMTKYTLWGTLVGNKTRFNSYFADVGYAMRDSGITPIIGETYQINQPE